jgi:hypothetical protein
MNIARRQCLILVGLALLLPGWTHGLVGSGGTWILTTGFWADSGVWLDSATWHD